MSLAGGRDGRASSTSTCSCARASTTASSGGGLERLTRLLLDLGVTHPLPVQAHARADGVGALGRVRPHRRLRRIHRAATIPSTRAPTAARPSSFYAERVRDAFRDAGESVNSVGQQLAGWLRGSGSSDEDLDGDEDAAPA